MYFLIFPVGFLFPTISSDCIILKEQFNLVSKMIARILQEFWKQNTFNITIF